MGTKRSATPRSNTRSNKGTTKKAPALSVEVLEKLHAILEAQRRLGPASYPPTVGRLLELAGEPELVAPLFKKHPSSSRISVLAPGKLLASERPAVLVFLTADLESVARSEAMFRKALAAAWTEKKNIFVVGELAKKLPTQLRPAFSKHWADAVKRADLPQGFASLQGDKTTYVFRLEDVRPRPGTLDGSAHSHAGHRADFAARFREAFDRLDRQTGGQNYVTLHALRAALADVARADFDAGLRALRETQQYTLDASDGRHGGVSAEELDAAIVEAGSRLVYAARKGR